MSALVAIPLWLILAAALFVFVLCLVTFIAVTAWFGMAKMIEDERQSTLRLRVDVHEQRADMRRIEDRP